MARFKLISHCWNNYFTYRHRWQIRHGLICHTKKNPVLKTSTKSLLIIKYNSHMKSHSDRKRSLNTVSAKTSPQCKCSTARCPNSLPWHKPLSSQFLNKFKAKNKHIQYQTNEADNRNSKDRSAPVSYVTVMHVFDKISDRKHSTTEIQWNGYDNNTSFVKNATYVGVYTVHMYMQYVGGAAQWLACRSVAGGLSLIYVWSMVDVWPLRG